MSANRGGQAGGAGDDFQRAAAAAVAEVGYPAWFDMAPQEQTRAIYAHLRQIDAARVRALTATSRRPSLRAMDSHGWRQPGESKPRGSIRKASCLGAPPAELTEPNEDTLRCTS